MRIEHDRFTIIVLKYQRTGAGNRVMRAVTHVMQHVILTRDKFRKQAFARGVFKEIHIHVVLAGPGLLNQLTFLVEVQGMHTLGTRHHDENSELALERVHARASLHFDVTYDRCLTAECQILHRIFLVHVFPRHLGQLADFGIVEIQVQLDTQPTFRILQRRVAAVVHAPDVARE